MSSKQQLIYAIKDGDNKKVSNLLDRMDVSVVNERQQTMPLNTACGHQNNGALNLLLAKPGIDVNAQDTIGCTPLHAACVHDNDQAISKLLAIPGIHVNAQNKAGTTPLHFACLADNDQAATRLLATPGIDVNPQTKNGDTPLHFACHHDNDHDAARLLATPGIDVNVKDNNGTTPIMVAADFDSEEAFKLLLHDHRVHLPDMEEMDLSGSGVQNQKYHDRIREERKKRETVSQKKDEESSHTFIENVEKINKKIKDNEQRWTKVVEKQELDSEKLARKHQEEKNQQELERNKLAKRHQEEKAQQELEMKKLATKQREEKAQKELEIVKLAAKHREEKTKEELTNAREAEANKQYITNLTEVRDDLRQDLEKIHFDKGKNDAANNKDNHNKLEVARGSLECPICLEFMEPPKRIWMCNRTHAMCEDCKNLLGRKPCPTCESENVNLRAYMIEKMAGILFSKPEV